LKITALQEQGKTVVFTVVDGKLADAFALADKIKQESNEAVKELKTLGVNVYILAGDAPKVAEWVSKERARLDRRRKNLSS
jgi:Cu2+-exporting ATPase